MFDEATMSRYGADEYRYASPIALGLVQSAPFRVWLIKKTRFSCHADLSRLLHEEQRARRTPQAENWWRSYWVTNSSCSCRRCGERETDLLAIFSTPDDQRFALHVEVKSPNDKFSLDQARDYPRRADCWKGREKAPKTILPHEDAGTVLVCDQRFVALNKTHASFFETVITFDEISSWLSPFPNPK